MKASGKSEENFFNGIMAQSKLELPFPDFEDNVMFQIEKERSFRHSVTKDVKLSWFFFIAGSVFGIVLSLMLPRMQAPIFGIDPQKLAICFQMIFVILLFTQLETLIKFIKKTDSKT